MKLDKYISVNEDTFTVTADGGSTVSSSLYWSGWAQVKEKNYSTVLESGQYVGSKASQFTIRKNEVTELINTSMVLVYRSKEYLIKDIIELDPFYLSIVAVNKERNGA